MIATVVTIPFDKDFGTGDKSSQRARVVVHINTEILSSEAAMHQARSWLTQNVSDSLGVATPELVVGDALYWRFEVTFGLQNKVQPGSGAVYSVGHLRLEAATGAVENAEALAAELRARIASIAP